MGYFELPASQLAGLGPGTGLTSKGGSTFREVSRDLVYEQFIKSTPYQVSVRVVSALPGLGTGSPDSRMADMAPNDHIVGVLGSWHNV